MKVLVVMAVFFWWRHGNLISFSLTGGCAIAVNRANTNQQLSCHHKIISSSCGRAAFLRLQNKSTIDKKMRFIIMHLKQKRKNSDKLAQIEYLLSGRRPTAKRIKLSEHLVSDRFAVFLIMRRIVIMT